MKVTAKLVHDNSKNVLVLEVRIVGTTKGRKRIKVQGLKNPDFRFWDKKEQCFFSGTDTARDNNAFLAELRDRCVMLENDEHINSPSDFEEAYRAGIVPQKETLGEYISNMIRQMKGGVYMNKRPSRTYQTYVALLHKLEQEGSIIDVPLKDICDVHFRQFGKWISSLPKKNGKGNNYSGLMKRFKTVHTKAFEDGRNDNILRFRYTKEIPTQDDTKHSLLTKEQYRKFCTLDLSTIQQSGNDRNFYKELYHDFCIFLYETKSRPVDVLKAHSDEIKAGQNINTGKPEIFWEYVPEKKKNYQRHKTVKTPLNTTALAIIKKYEGQSSRGYVFPFAMNEYDWSGLKEDAEKWNKWNIRKQRALEMINVWLKKVQKPIGFDGNLTLYTFRHSAFTHACNADNANWGLIALEGGTSIKMLERHYVQN